MSMETVLEGLEERIESLITALQASRRKVGELEVRVEEFEERANDSIETTQRLAELDSEREKLGKRLEGVLTLIDRALDSGR